MSEPTDESVDDPGAIPGETALSRLRRRAEERAAQARARLEALQASAGPVPPAGLPAAAAAVVPAVPEEPAVPELAAVLDVPELPAVPEVPEVLASSDAPAGLPAPDPAGAEPPGMQPCEVGAPADPADAVAPVAPVAPVAVALPTEEPARGPELPAAPVALESSEPSEPSGPELDDSVAREVAPDVEDHLAEPPAWAALEEPAAVPRRRRGRVALAVLLVLLLAASIAAGVFWLRRADDVNHRQSLREQARLSAAMVAEQVTTLNYLKLDDWLARVQAVSTGGLREEFAQRKVDLAVVVTGQELDAKGTAVRTTAELDKGARTAQCLVVLDRRVVTQALPAGQTDLQRYVVRLKRVDGRWLATFVSPVEVTL